MNAIWVLAHGPGGACSPDHQNNLQVRHVHAIQGSREGEHSSMRVYVEVLVMCTHPHEEREALLLMAVVRRSTVSSVFSLV